MIVNVHERAYNVPVSKTAPLLATLASEDDSFWPWEEWPRMRFDLCRDEHLTIDDHREK